MTVSNSQIYENLVWSQFLSTRFTLERYPGLKSDFIYYGITYDKIITVST